MARPRGGQRYEGRDLAVTTDFRDVFGEIVVRHLGVDESAAPIFPGYAVQPSKFPGLFALSHRRHESSKSLLWLSDRI